MVSMIIWVVALAGSIAAVCMAVAFDAQLAHVGATALVTLGLVASAVNEHKSAESEGASPYSLSAIAARFMGLLWGWSAVSAYVVYSFLLDWSHWMPTVVAMYIGCALCLFVALVLDREAASPSPDRRTIRMVASMAKSQFVLAALLFGGLLAIRNHPELTMGGAHKWVALNLVMCTSAGLLTLTGYLILQTWTARATSADPELVRTSVITA